jgi:hypothetical protein
MVLTSLPLASSTTTNETVEAAVTFMYPATYRKESDTESK